MLITQDTRGGSPWEPWTQNLYAYVHNDPVNFVDPTGQGEEDRIREGDGHLGLGIFWWQLWKGGNWTIMAEFVVCIDYHQIAMFDSTMKRPFNKWTDVHVRQGFSWRPGSVSFGTLMEAGKVTVRVSSGGLDIPEGAIRSIVVPFTVGDSASEVGGVFDSVQLALPLGDYELMFSIVPGHDDELDTYHFCFVKSANPKVRILLADAELCPPQELCMTADPA